MDQINREPSRKATAEFLPLLNTAFHAWQSGTPYAKNEAVYPQGTGWNLSKPGGS